MNQQWRRSKIWAGGGGGGENIKGHLLMPEKNCRPHGWATKKIFGFITSKSAYLAIFHIISTPEYSLFNPKKLPKTVAGQGFCKGIIIFSFFFFFGEIRNYFLFYPLEIQAKLAKLAKRGTINAPCDQTRILSYGYALDGSKLDEAGPSNSIPF